MRQIAGITVRLPLTRVAAQANPCLAWWCGVSATYEQRPSSGGCLGAVACWFVMRGLTATTIQLAVAGSDRGDG